VELVASGDGNAQVLPDFVGERSNHRNTGHRVYLPDNITISGSNYRYTQATEYPIIMMCHGAGSTPTSTETNTLSTFKTAMTNGDIPPCIIVYPNQSDPDDGSAIDCYGQNCADGSFPLEDILRYDLWIHLAKRVRCVNSAARRVMCGFSMGGFATLRMRAKFGSSGFAAYCVFGAPRLDNDLGGADFAYTNSYNSNEKAKIFSNDVANCRANSPFSSSSSSGLFNLLGNNAGGLGSAPLLMMKSDPGDSTTTNSMNNAINTRLPGASVSFDSGNLDNATFTPTHNLGQYFTAWAAETTLGPGWIKTNAGW
jgi:hypothetical protein